MFFSVHILVTTLQVVYITAVKTLAPTQIALVANSKNSECGASLWQMFRNYHYLNGSLPSTARCYTTAYQNKPNAFIAVVHTHMKARYYRVSRIVVLPDYQGIGIGKRLLNFIAELYTSQTKIPFCILTSNPQMI